MLLFTRSVLVFLCLLVGCNPTTESLVETLDCSSEADTTGIFAFVAESQSSPLPSSGPVPTQQQLTWQQDELYMFIHFGINTFTGNEWGDGTESPSLFNPSRINVDQWVSVAKRAGFKGVILTAKHHEGFALWPTAYSSYSVKNSPWENGKGDVVKLVAEACERYGLKFGIYLSPWDQHEKTYGTPAYHDFFVGQLTELLTQYGPIFEVWLDGARAPGVTFEYDFRRYLETIRRLQPDALVANLGPDIRWVGNEIGVAPETVYSGLNDSWWYPVECDVSIRPGWFWKSKEDSKVKSLSRLLDIYYKCIGRNSVLLLNVPPNNKGEFTALDIERLYSFSATINRIFENNQLVGQVAVGSNEREGKRGWRAQGAIDDNAATFWATDSDVRTATLEVTVDDCQVFNVIKLQEPIQYGQRIDRYQIDIWRNGHWQEIIQGSTIGYKKLHRITEVSTSKIRLTLHSERASPALQAFGVYLD